MFETPLKRLIFGIGLIFFVSLILYLPAIQSGFIWDDDSFLTENPLIEASDGLSRFWFSTEPPDYFPLTSTTLWFEWRLWGMDAAGYHLVNCLLHIASAVLLWLILKRLKIPGAWLAGLIFAVHPVNVEAVAWITQRKTTLPMLFYVISIWLYLKYEDDGSKRLYGFSIFSFLLALLGKTSIVMQPFVLLGCAWWRRGRIDKKDLLRAIPFFALSFSLSLVTIWFQYNRSIGAEIVRTDPFFARLAGAGWAIWFYLGKALLPLKLIFVYPRWDIDASLWLSYLPGVLFLSLLFGAWQYRKIWGRPVLFGLGYFAVTLFPMLGFFNIYYFRYSLVADHYQYQSIIGIIALVVGGGCHLFTRCPKRYHQTVFLVVAVVVSLLGVQTFRQGGNYADVETIFLDTHAKNPTSWMPLYNLGHLKQKEKKYAQAVHYYTTLGNLYLEQKKYSQALHNFSQALNIKPDFAETHYNLATALMEMKRFKEATEHFYQALRFNPRMHVAHNNLANALVSQGRLHQSLPHYRAALRIKPNFAEARRNMDIILKRIRSMSTSG